jgi:hypothetical protein
MSCCAGLAGCGRLRGKMTVRLAPIESADVQAVAEFLHAQLNSRVSAGAWQAALSVPWKVDSPNAGFMLTDEGAVVGAYLAFYSERSVAGQPERFCNLGAWCVLPEYRFHSIRLLKALLAQDGYHFTDLSPSGNVIQLNERLKFRALDTTTALIPNLPWPPLSRRARITSRPAALADRLAGPELTLYLDHQRAAAAHHLLISRGGEDCYVIFRRSRRKNLPLFAVILYASNPRLLRDSFGQVRTRLLLRHGALATLAELRTIGSRPRLSALVPAPRPKMFRSATLAPGQIDDLYSELTCVPW